MVDVIGSIVILLSRCCLPNDKGPAPLLKYFFLEPPLCFLSDYVTAVYTCSCFVCPKLFSFEEKNAFYDGVKPHRRLAMAAWGSNPTGSIWCGLATNRTSGV